MHRATFNLATFNLMHGRSVPDGLVDATRLRTAVAALDVDVLALQEADRGQPRSAGADHTAEAARALGAAHHRFAAALVGTPGGAYRLAGDADDTSTDPLYGIGLVSRWPVTQWLLLRLPAAPLRSPVVVPRAGVVLLTDEPRVVLAAIVDSPIGRLTVASTHLSFVPGWNLRQLRRTLRWLAGLPAPRLLLGDLNLPMRVLAPYAAATGWRPLARVATYPAARPRVQLDHILLHPRRTTWSVSTRTPFVSISDHRPLVVDVTS